MSRHGRRVVVNTLDVGHCSFADFLTERLHALHQDLVQECDRIAVSRELRLVQEVEKLHGKIRTLSESAVEDAGSWLDADMPDEEADHVQRKEEVAPFTNVRVSADATEPNLSGNVVTGGSIDALDDSDRALPECSAKPEEDTQPFATFQEYFVLWPEWGDKASSLEADMASQSDEDVVKESQMELDWLQRHNSGTDLDYILATKASSLRFSSPYEYCGTLPPSSTFAICWELLGVPILFYDLVTIPLQVFYSTQDDAATEFLAWAVIFYWTLDMVLRFLVFGFVSSAGQVHLKRTEIMKNYLTNSFGFDLLLVGPDWICLAIGAPRNISALRVFRLVRLMRVLRMSKLRRIIREIEDLVDSEYFCVVVSIWSNLAAIIGVCHYLACLWYALGEVLRDSDDTWLEYYEIIETPKDYQYVISLHWAITQFTPGGSRIQPCNAVEAIVAILVLIFGMVFFSLFISSITQQRMHLKALTSKLDRDSWLLRRYMKQHGVSKDLTSRAVKYVDACVAPMLRRVQRKDVFLFEYLSHPLQLEVQAELFYHTLLYHPFLRQLRQRSSALTSTLFANAVIEIALAETDLLFVAGNVSHEMYFVSRGALAYLRHGTDQVTVIRPGEWCCEPVLWVPWVFKGICRAPSECYIVSIDSAKMRKVVLEHKERKFVRRVANEYLKELTAYVSQGNDLSDIFSLSDSDKASQYAQVLHEADAKASSELEAKPVIGEMEDQIEGELAPDVPEMP